MARSKPLVIVESPTKVKTISRILGDRYKVASSMGHLVDLPKSSLGVDIDHEFKPKLIVVRDKQKILTRLKKEAKTKKKIYIATDPDREGEAIGFNIAQHLGEGKDVLRVTFQEITKEAVLKAFEHPRKFDEKKISAQVTRRILDRIVGYKISPLLWSKVGSRLSAGRVQSVALRLIVEREREIQNFVPQEYWQIKAELVKPGSDQVLTAQLEKIDQKKPQLKNEKQAREAAEDLRRQTFEVSEVSERKTQRKAPPPYITSTMQQDAFNRIGFNANRTMSVAQQLYEGIEIGKDEPVGLITYMRTDSVNVSAQAIAKVRDLIQKEYGADYLPAKPNVYKSKKSAQEAHEAIRPTNIHLKPNELKPFLTPDQYRLYDLIWKRFVASQMRPAEFLNKKLRVKAGRYTLGASGTTLLFDGFLVLHLDPKEEDSPIDFRLYQKGDLLEVKDVIPSQHFTKPPPRYSDASLVKALEEDGIGRPSTYAAIIQTLVARNYAARDRGYFTATELGMTVNDLLVKYFPRIMDVKFTAAMEENLDKIEEGDLDSVNLLRDFYDPFLKELKFAMANIEKTENFVDKTCPHCGSRMVMKWGRRGQFLSCSAFPNCKYAEPITTGVKCPEPGCEGELVQRRSRRGRFYGCTQYPKCTYTANQLPETSPPVGGTDAAPPSSPSQDE